MEGVFFCNRMRITLKSELRVNRICQELEVMREANDNETSSKIFGGTLVGVSQLRIS